MAEFEFWYPFYPAHYRRDTMHLTAEQDGVYRRLIDHYMETRTPLPNNGTALARIAGVSTEHWEILKEFVLPFFLPYSRNGKTDSAMLCHKKCDFLLSQQGEKKEGNISQKSMAGKLGAMKRWGGKATESKKKNSGAIKVPSKKHSKPIAENSYKREEESIGDIYSEDKSSSFGSSRKIDFDVDAVCFTGIDEKTELVWRNTYPHVDIEAELKKACAWLHANPKKRKSDYPKFLNGWFSRHELEEVKAKTAAAKPQKPIGEQLKRVSQNKWD